VADISPTDHIDDDDLVEIGEVKAPAPPPPAESGVGAKARQPKPNDAGEDDEDMVELRAVAAPKARVSPPAPPADVDDDLVEIGEVKAPELPEKDDTHLMPTRRPGSAEQPVAMDPKEAMRMFQSMRSSDPSPSAFAGAQTPVLPSRIPPHSDPGKSTKYISGGQAPAFPDETDMDNSWLGKMAAGQPVTERFENFITPAPPAGGGLNVLQIVPPSGFGPSNAMKVVPEIRFRSPVAGSSPVLPPLTAEDLRSPVSPEDRTAPLIDAITAIGSSGDQPMPQSEGGGLPRLVGTSLQGYQILSEVGSGTVGTVFKAHQISMDRIVALKIMPPSLTRNAALVTKFMAEARAAGRLNHTNVIRVHEVGRSGNLFFYSMEYVEGESMEVILRRINRVPVDLAVSVMRQVALALEHGIKFGIIHREIRPRVIMVSSEGNVKLADLGLTRPGISRFIAGDNAQYMAPEQLNDVADTRSDVYSLGATVYRAVTGLPPFQLPSPQAVIREKQSKSPPPAVAVAEDIPPALSELISHMMAPDPDLRPQTPTEVLTMLEKIPLEPPTGRGTALRRPIGRRGQAPGLRRGMGGRTRRRRRHRR
jgi:hypothetical protein